jgi:hypothetical protein
MTSDQREGWDERCAEMALVFGAYVRGECTVVDPKDLRAFLGETDLLRPDPLDGAVSTH